MLQLRRLIAAEGAGRGMESLLELIEPPKVAVVNDGAIGISALVHGSAADEKPRHFLDGLLRCGQTNALQSSSGTVPSACL